MCAIDDSDIDMRGLATSQLHCISTHMSYNPCGRTTLPAPPTLALSFCKLIMAVDAANSCFGAASHVSAAGG